MRSLVDKEDARPGRPQVSAVAAAALFLLLFAAPARAQFTAFAHDPRAVVEGNWQSCREDDGEYAERVYDHVVNGVGQFELHLGPRHEFALFKGVDEDHRDHESRDNLLADFDVSIRNERATRTWRVPSLGLVLTVTLAGGSRQDCESWFVTLVSTDRGSH
jgi:hypothetical protein